MLKYSFLHIPLSGIMAYQNENLINMVFRSKFLISLKNTSVYNRLLFSWFESHRIWASALVVDEQCTSPSHWRSIKTLSDWMKEENVPGICGIDTRELTKKIREKGTILGRIIYELPIPTDQPAFTDPNLRNLVEEVSIKVKNTRL